MHASANRHWCAAEDWMVMVCRAAPWSSPSLAQSGPLAPVILPVCGQSGTAVLSVGLPCLTSETDPVAPDLNGRSTLVNTVIEVTMPEALHCVQSDETATNYLIQPSAQSETLRGRGMGGETCRYDALMMPIKRSGCTGTVHVSCHGQLPKSPPCNICPARAGRVISDRDDICRPLWKLHGFRDRLLRPAGLQGVHAVRKHTDRRTASSGA
nr:hypothetical protein CFP56_24049 [Quercus suber]